MLNEQRHDRGTTRRTAEFIVGDDTFTYTASDGVSGLQRGDGDGDGDG